MRPLLIALLFAVLAVPSSAQEREVLSAPAPAAPPLPAPAEDDVYRGVNQLRESAAARGLRPSAAFQVTYTGFSSQAEAAFQFAVDIWAAHVASSVPIKVDATFEALTGNVLGSAGAGCIHGGGTLPIGNTWYPAALADAITGVDQYSPTGPCSPADIVARFASNRNDWYFGTDGNTPSGQIDFVTVVMHELGHGLGFFGSGNVDNGSGDAECNGTSGVGCFGLGGASLPVIFDRFIEDAGGVSLLNSGTYPNPSAALGTLLRSQNLFYDSPTTFAIYGNERPPIWAPAAWDGGSSFSHWDENVIRNGDVNALMTPELARGESYPDPGPLTCALMKDIGWTLSPACTTLVDTPTEGGPLASGLALERAGPNPFRSATALRVRIGEPQTLRATLHDALGREVQVLYDGAASGDVTLSIGGDLAPGIYAVRVDGEAESAVERFVRIR